MQNLALRIAVERERRRRRTPLPPPPALDSFLAATKIKTPQEDGGSAVPFDLWPAQRAVLTQMEHEPKLVILKARQLGISWLACGYALWLCTTQPGRAVLLFSQGQLEADELITRIGFMYHAYADKDKLPAGNLVTDNTRELEWANGSNIKSLPATRRAGRSFTASLVIFDEFAFMLFGSSLYDAAKPTVDDGGKLWIISSADGPGTAYHQFWQAAVAGTTGFTPVFLPWQARPSRDTQWRERKLAEAYGDVSGVLREYPENDLEAFTHAAGRIFDVWSDGPDDGNVTDEAVYIPDGGPILWAVDDGYSGERDRTTGLYTADSHPRVILICQLKGDGRLDVLAESYAVKTLSDAQITDALTLPYPPPEYAAHGPGAGEFRGRLMQANIPPRFASCQVEESTKELHRQLAPDSNGWRRIRVHPSCKNLRFEMGAYRRDVVTEKPIKQHDHGPDAIRYLAWDKRHEG